jgi:hypothetical protein
MTTLDYRKRLRALLTPAEHRAFARLDTPQKIQTYLDRTPANYCLNGDTAMSPRTMLKAKLAHCAEGATFAAAALLYHGKPAWLVDMRALPTDQDHIITLFKVRGLWGAISKTNHAILRWRDPIYRTPRELLMSYAHEYCLSSGRKSLLEYTRPIAMTRYAPQRWVTLPEDLDWLLVMLDDAPHIPLAPKAAMKKLRRATPVEIKAQSILDWPDPRPKKKKTKPANSFKKKTKSKT